MTLADAPAMASPTNKATAAIRPSDEVTIFGDPFGHWQALSHFCDHYDNFIVIHCIVAKFFRLSSYDGLLPASLFPAIGNRYSIRNMFTWSILRPLDELGATASKVFAETRNPLASLY